MLAFSWLDSNLRKSKWKSWETCCNFTNQNNYMFINNKHSEPSADPSCILKTVNIFKIYI